MAKVSGAELSKGDGVFFKRGDLFRGQLKTQAGVTYSAFGCGEKPKIYGSEKNYAEDKSFWKKTDKENVYVSSDTFDADVGLLAFDNGKYYTFKQIEKKVRTLYAEESSVDVETSYTVFDGKNFKVCRCRDKSVLISKRVGFMRLRIKHNPILGHIEFGILTLTVIVITEKP